MDKSSKYIVQSKGQYPPTNGDNASWDFYFYKNKGRVAAAVLALKHFGKETIVKAQGQQRVEEKRGASVMEVIAKKRMVPLDEATVQQNFGEMYYRHLVRFLKATHQWTEELQAVAA